MVHLRLKEAADVAHRYSREIEHSDEKQRTAGRYIDPQGGVSPATTACGIVRNGI